jgi:hypothetical protein
MLIPRLKTITANCRSLFRPKSDVAFSRRNRHCCSQASINFTFVIFIRPMKDCIKTSAGVAGRVISPFLRKFLPVCDENQNWASWESFATQTRLHPESNIFPFFHVQELNTFPGTLPEFSDQPARLEWPIYHSLGHDVHVNLIYLTFHPSL